jgi:hypothetical protein
MAPRLITLMSSGSKKKEPRYICVDEMVQTQRKKRHGESKKRGEKLFQYPTNGFIGPVSVTEGEI